MSKNKAIGARGEDIAAQFLKEKGMIILERNIRSARAEIDIIAFEDRALRFVEVKSRMERSEESVTSSLSNSKLRQLVKGAADYVAKYRVDGVEDIYFDLIIIIFMEDGSHTLEYTPSFFYPGW